VNTKSKTLKLLVAVGFVTITILVAWVTAAEKEADQQQAKKVFNLPEGTLELRENQLVARKHAAGWQLCRVKRFVWQDTLVVLQSQDKFVGLIREADTADSRPPSDNNGLFVVLEVAAQTFATLDQVKPDERLLKSMSESDEVLVKATIVRPPTFSLLK